MGQGTDEMIKKAISQTIVDEMFRELGFYVLRMGEEDIANPLTQLDYFIKKCGGKISIDKKDIEVIRKMPDFCIISKEGRVSFVEVKFSKSNMLNEVKTSSIFELYPDTYIILVNLEIGENLLFQKFGEEIYTKEGNLEEMKKENSRFNMVFCDFDDEEADKEEGEESIYAVSLKEWLKEEFNIEADSIIKRYEDLVIKWLKPKEEN